MKFNAAVIVEDIKLPDYKGRHVFTAKLRLSIFVVSWIIGFFYFESIWKMAPWIPFAISIAFLITGICYENILKNRWLMFSFLMEIIADLFSMTLVVYLTGGPKSEYFLLYIMYCVAAGMFYNYQVALVAASLSLVFYGLMLLAVDVG